MAALKPVAVAQNVPGFFDSLLHYLGSSADYFSARLSLFGNEAKDAAGNYLKLLILVVAALVLLFFSYPFLVIGLVFILQRLTGWDWLYITLGVGFLHVAGAVACLLMAKGRLGTSSFSATMAEFKKDKQWLTKKAPMPASVS